MRLMRLVIVCVVMALMAGPAMAWGPTAHEIIAKNAIELLPDDLKTFYNEINGHYVVALISLPDHWRDTHKAEIGNQHYIDLDLLAKPPFDSLVMSRSAAEKKFGKDELSKAGILPWAIEDRFNRLVKAFKEGDATGIVVQSAVLGHYIGDAHVPFHVTKDYDGKRPEQAGVHFRFEENLVELYLRPESIKPQSPELVTDPLKSAFKWCIDSFGKVDPILAADDTARAAGPGLNWPYWQSFNQDAGPIMRGQITHASQAMAGAIIAAWKAAGKPELTDKAAPLFWGM